MRLFKTMSGLVVAGLIGLVTACGGESGFIPAGNSANLNGPVSLTLQGAFIDSAVEGVQYTYGSLVSKTDAKGKFLYNTGSSVKFTIGDILIGEALGAPVITPVDFVISADDETDSVVTNIARFLQTLDNDANPENGITITKEVFDLGKNKSIDFNQSISKFSEDGNVQIVVAEMTAATEAGARLLVDASVAQAHLKATLATLAP